MTQKAVEILSLFLFADNRISQFDVDWASSSTILSLVVIAELNPG